MPFERESFVLVCTSLTFVCTLKDSEILYKGCAKTETRCISEAFEVQTKVREVQTGTNDSLSNAVGPISISLKLAKFAI